MFDSHTHLNFKPFNQNFDLQITAARKAGVNFLLIPGTDLPSSQKAIEIALKHENVFCSVGFHPHHLFSYLGKNAKLECAKMGRWLKNPKVVALGETGFDQHHYTQTRHQSYQVTNQFINLQKEFFLEHINLSLKYKKSLIVHNRMSTKILLSTLNKAWDQKLARKVVFHCCEAEEDLVKFAKEHKIFIGVDGDITYDLKKQKFIQTVPTDLLILETDSPYLTPQDAKVRFPNTPANLRLICDFVSRLLGIEKRQLEKITDENCFRLLSFTP